MKIENKILFLGESDSPLIKWLQQKGEHVTIINHKITVDYILEKSFYFLISYGYRHIIKADILDLFPNRAINLHISYLPYNRGADPNFWSFIEGSPKGVTIHYINEGIDTGDIIVQRKVVFELLKIETLASTYQKLHKTIQLLFFENWELIKQKKCARTAQQGKATIHRLKDKEQLFFLIEKDGWNTKISTLVDYSKKINNYEN